MNTVWQRANQKEWVAFLSDCMSPLLYKRNALYTHGLQTCEQKCSAEPLSKDFSIYLVGRFVDAQFLQHLGELPVSDATSRHLAFNQLFRRLFPYLVELYLLANLTWQFAHCTSIAFNRQLHFWYQTFSHHHYPSYTTALKKLVLYVLVNHFCENELLNKTLSAALFVQHLIIELLRTADAGIQLPYRTGAT